MAIEWRVLTGDELAEADERSRQYWAAQAEHEAKVKACGEHDWVLDLEHPDGDDEAPAHLNCLKCPAYCDDLFPDAHEMMYLCIDDVEVVKEGYHTLPHAARVPVTANVLSTRHSSPNGEEWDIELILEATGPIVILEDEE